MRAATIAELKNHLRHYLKQVCAGEEIVIRDRNVAIAKLVPLGPDDDPAAERAALIASGQLRAQAPAAAFVLVRPRPARLATRGRRRRHG